MFLPQKQNRVATGSIGCVGLTVEIILQYRRLSSLRVDLTRIR